MGKQWIKKQWVLMAIPALAFFLGVAERGYTSPLDSDTLLSTCIAIVIVALIFTWFRLDAREHQIKTSWALNIAMVVLTALALPWYLIRSRSKRRMRALGLMLLMFVATLLLYQLSSTFGVEV